MRHVSIRNEDEHEKPLSEPVFLILTSLAEQPRHGYALLQDIEKSSDGRMALSTGTLYGALRRLLDSDWIERFEDGDTSRDKQAYRLTASGKRRLGAEVQRMDRLSAIATSRLKRREA